MGEIAVTFEGHALIPLDVFEETCEAVRNGLDALLFGLPHADIVVKRGIPALKSDEIEELGREAASRVR